MKLKTPNPSLLRQLQRLWQPMAEPRAYRQWRRQFLLRRLTFAAWVGMAIRLLILGGGLLLEAIDPDRSAPVWVTQWDEIYTVLLSVAMFILMLLLLQLPRFRQSPSALILLFPLALWTVPELQDLLTIDSISLDQFLLLVFWFQAILLPVQWRYHLLSQLLSISLLAAGLGLSLGLNWSEIQADASNPGQVQGLFGILLVLFTYQLTMAAIANITVYHQERLRIQEFNLRSSLQLFLHAVSHDLRPPVMGTIMLIQQLKNEHGEVELSQAMVQQMLKSGDRQLQLIQSLQLAHESEVQLQLAVQPIQLKPLILDVLREMQPLFNQADATTQVNIAPDLSPVLADPLQLHRVFENLISNGLQYNQPGIQLTFSAEQRGREVHCTVCDNGRGMTREQCDRLFDRYSRSINSRHPLHLGLGLYICQQIITAHGGRITAQSQPGEGTCFRFSLPFD